MYESYAWPGAYSVKTEIKMLFKKVKEHFNGVLKKIEKAEKKI